MKAFLKCPKLERSFAVDVVYVQYVTMVMGTACVPVLLFGLFGHIYY